MKEKNAMTPGAKLGKQQCSTCPFRPSGIQLPPERMEEIRGYLIKGVNHMCHSDQSNRTVCVGGRKYTLEIWHRLGWISAPTNEALRLAMSLSGVHPKRHI